MMLFALALVWSVAPGVSAQDDLSDLRSERDRVRREKAEQAQDVDAYGAEAGELAAALDAIDAQLASQEAQLEGINLAAEVIAEEITAADARVVATQERIAAQHAQIADAAVEAYVRSPNERLEIALGSVDINDAAKKDSLRDMSVGRTTDALDQLRRVEAELEAAERDAELGRQRVIDYRSQIEEETAQVQELRDAQDQIYSEAEARYEQSLYEAQILSDQERSISTKILAAEREIAARLARQRSRSSSSGGTGSSTVGSGEIVRVRGIRVHVSIADSLDAMLAKAASDNVDLSGGGYRNPSDQIRVRRNNCGTSNYAIYQMPASRCRPPTARPGRSMHEQGKAIDFTYNGRIISSRGSVAFKWLAANAATYGFHNLPSEPWHWSVNGR